MAYQSRKGTTPGRGGGVILLILGTVMLLSGVLYGIISEGFFPAGIFWIALSITFFLYGIHTCRHANDTQKEQPQKTASTLPDPQPIASTGETESFSLLNPPVRVPDILTMSANPYAAALEDAGPDGLRDDSDVVCWLTAKEDADIHLVIRESVRWINEMISSMPALPSQEQRTHCLRDSLLQMRYKQYIKLKKIILTQNPSLLSDVSEEEKQQCESVNITFAMMDGIELHDLITGKSARLVTQEWPGTVDDAATYGSWELVWR